MCQELIYALSAKGQISFTGFSAILSTLYYQSEVGKSEDTSWDVVLRNTRRFLEDLGYCDIDYEKHKVSACPPALVLLPQSGLPSAILTGVYIPGVITTIKDYAKNNLGLCKLEWLSHPREQPGAEFIPDTLHIIAVSVDLIKDMAKAAEIKAQTLSNASEQLLQFSNSIAGFSTTLNFTVTQSVDPTGWEKQEFNADELRFYWGTFTYRNSRLARYQIPDRRYTSEIWYWKGTEYAVVDRYWGPWMLLQEVEKNVILHSYNELELFVPSSVPLPRLLARAMTLCSGTVPRQERLIFLNGAFRRINKENNVLNSTFLFDVYGNVTQPMADALAAKLGQRRVTLSETALAIK